MKKLKLNLANLQGTEVLTREQLKKVMGGDMGSGGAGGNGFCWLTTYNAKHIKIETFGVLMGAECPTASSYANTYCVDLIATPGNGVYYCSYNCGCS